MKQTLLFLLFLLSSGTFSYAQTVANPAPDITQCGNEVFNLTTQTPIVLGGQNPAQFTVSYFTSYTDAVANANPIATPNFFITQQNVITVIHARVTSTADASFAISQFTVVWYSGSSLGFFPDISICDSYTLPNLPASQHYFTSPGGTGTELFAGDQITTSTTIFVYLAEGTCTAEASFEIIIFPSPSIIAPDVISCGSYTLPALPSGQIYQESASGPEIPTGTVITASQMVYIFAEGQLCDAFQGFHVSVDGPVAIAPDPLVSCSPDGIATFDLTATLAQITNGNPQPMVSVHETVDDAYFGVNPVGPIYTTVNPGVQVLYVRVTDATVSCHTIVPLTLLVPLCSDSTIAGNVSFDDNGNGCADAGLALAGVKISCTNGDYVMYAYTNADGYYEFDNIIDGTNVVSVVESSLPYGVVPASDEAYTFTIEDDALYSANFCAIFDVATTEASITLVPVTNVRVAGTAEYDLYVSNLGNATFDATITVNFDAAKLTFSSAFPPPATVTPGALTFLASDVTQYNNALTNLIFSVNAPPAVNAGDVLTISASVSISGTEQNLANNAISLTQVAVASFDPNDITVHEGAIISQEQAEDYLTYTVRFQNTGTDYAENINVVNQLDALLDWNTFVPVASSHPYFAQQNGGEVTFRFTQINLPAQSQDEAQSNGSVTYKIKPLPGLEVGQVVEASAAIYFDFNEPVITNEVTTQIENLGLTDYDAARIKIYPNPAREVVTVNAGTSILNISVFDLTGKKVLSESPTLISPSQQLDISSLVPGIYLLRVMDETKSATAKLMVR